jgi:hypothetical protein
MRRRSQGTAGTGNQAFNKRRGAGTSPADVRFIRTNQMPGKTAHGRHLPEPQGPKPPSPAGTELLGGLLDLAPRALWPGGLGSSTLTLLQLALDRFQCVDFVRLLDRRDLAHQPV